jgi:hypothetical protein
MTDRRAYVRQPATSWGAVIGGWVATIGASVIFAPLVAGLVAAFGSQHSATDVVAAVPFVLGILLSYVVGGYVAGRMAGYRTSWHGMMTAFFSLFILLIVLLAGGLAGTGALAGTGITSLGDIIPGTRDLNIDSFGNALSFGAMLGFLAAIFGGWLGGLLAPSYPVAAVPVREGVAHSPVSMHQPVSMREHRHVEEKPRRTVIPAYGRKGGERVDERVERTEEHVEKRSVDEVHRPTSDN